jgi:hypothetical protein
VLLVARERGVEPGEKAVAAVFEQFVLVEEVGLPVRVAAEQPVAAARPCRTPLLQEGAKRRDAGAGTDHDHWPVGRR